MKKKIYLILLTQILSFSAQGSWQVDCGTFCFFNEFPNNCQGVYYQYDKNTPNSSKSYASWNQNLNGCYEKNTSKLQSHLLKREHISCICPFSIPNPPRKSENLSAESRKQLQFLRAAIRGWQQCAPSWEANYTDRFKPFDWHKVDSCESFIKRGQEGTYFPTGNCLSGLFPWHLVTANQCNFNGDQNANTASDCLAGEQWLCKQISAAQNVSTGAWYRNPFMRRFPETAGFQPSFSRDQLIGSLAFWITSKNKSSLLKWLGFVKANGKTAPWAGKFLYNLCPQRPNTFKPSNLSWADWNGQLADDRCAILNVTWGQIYMVAKAIGISDNEIRSISTEIHDLMLTGDLLLEDYLLSESLSIPVTGTLSFMANNTFKMLKIATMVKGKTAKLQQAFRNLSSRTLDLHPGYLLFSEGKPNELGAYLIKKYCPIPRPTWGGKHFAGYDNVNNPSIAMFEGVGIFERNYQFMGGTDPYGGNFSPSGYDCVEMINLYLGNSTRHRLKCKGNDPLINNACLRVGFEKPTLAKILGLGYEFNPWNARIRYKAFDHKLCPYGGILGDGPFTKQCFLDTNLNPAQLLKNVNYMVDVESHSPGVYYVPKNNRCQLFREKKKGSRCQVISYRRPLLNEETVYSITSRENDFAITYQPQNYSCPFGGELRGESCQIMLISRQELSYPVKYFIRKNPAYPGVFYYPDVVTDMNIRVPTNPRGTLK